MSIVGNLSLIMFKYRNYEKLNNQIMPRPVGYFRFSVASFIVI